MLSRQKALAKTNIKFEMDILGISLRTRGGVDSLFKMFGHTSISPLTVSKKKMNQDKFKSTVIKYVL
jgi:hypothetical protein